MMREMREVHVSGGDIEIVVLPEAGARLHSLKVREQERLRAPDDLAQHLADPFFWGGYVMAPWSNRIAPGPVQVGGRTVDLPANFRDGSAIHGQVYAAAWDETGPSSFAIEHEGDGWPWRYRVEVAYAVVDSEVDGSSVDVTLSLRNLSDEPMPAGIGLHPWFPTPVEARINSDLTYGSNLGFAAQPFPVSGILDVRHRQPLAEGVDASWAQPSDPAFELFWADGLHLSVRSSQPTLHVVAAYAPELGSIAVEPETNAPQALSRMLGGLPGGLELIEPGAELCLPITLEFAWTTSTR